MSEEQLKAFWEAIQADAGLQEKLSAAKDADAVVAIAEAAGFEISEEELAKAKAQLELSDEQLRDVSGGQCNVYCQSGPCGTSAA
jgi:predicted ribosomally synthesized peptide with nif11-like leader